MSVKDHILLFIGEKPENHVTVSVYEKWRDAQKKEKIANFIYERHCRRYIKPFEYDSEKYRKEYKNGFAIMANCCLLIETMESFYRGWPKSRNEINFLKFFSRVKEFKEFATDDMPTQFYKHIRCGILHQGETTGGWTVNRIKPKLLDKQRKEINAFLFSQTLKHALANYRDELIKSDWNSPVWKNLREKMKSIIKNCKRT